MTRRKQTYSAWGLTPRLRARVERRGGLPTYAMRDPDEYETGLDAVRRAIARRTGLAVCSTSPQGMSLPERERHYQITLGRPCSGGGYSVEGEMWIAIPPDADPTAGQRGRPRTRARA